MWELKKGLLRGKEAILSLIYPVFCLSCELFLPEGGVFCPSCLSTVHSISPPFCPLCGLPYPISYSSEHLCADCASEKRYFRAARASILYHGMGRDLIHAFKFRKKKTLLPLLSRLMIEGLSSYPDLVAVDLVLPVPLHRRVERERGFNQSALLGKMVADEKGLPFSTGVIRKIKPTPPQSSLGREERKKAVTGAFAAKNEKRPLAGKKVLLIDDVLTTGATANECARVILAAGAKEVFVFTLARTPYRI